MILSLFELNAYSNVSQYQVTQLGSSTLVGNLSVIIALGLMLLFLGSVVMAWRWVGLLTKGMIVSAGMAIIFGVVYGLYSIFHSASEKALAGNPNQLYWILGLIFGIPILILVGYLVERFVPGGERWFTSEENRQMKRLREIR